VKDVSQAVASLCMGIIRKMRQHPYEINCGSCDDFAAALCIMLGGESESADGPELRWGDNDPQFFTPAHDPDAHCYVFYKGKYYDAEEPYGVDRPDMLPVFMRQICHRADFLASINRAVASHYKKVSP
jgi:hypothetical protein